MINIKGDLPSGWERASILDLCKLVMGQSPSSDTYNTTGKGIPFFQGKAEFGEVHPEIAKYCSAPNKIADANSVLMSVRAPVGPTNINEFKCCIGRGLAAFSPLGGVDTKFVFYLLRSIERVISQDGTGSTFSAINKQYIEGLRFGVPPLFEQRRIIDKLEELFSELDNGIESLKTAREQLKVYRQSLLKHAFEGRLTEQWRKDNADKLESADELLARIQYEREERYQQRLEDWKSAVESWSKSDSREGRPTKPRSTSALTHLGGGELDGLVELPKGWSWVNFDSICYFENGDRGKNYPNRSEYVNKGLPWINTGHIEPDGSLSSDRMNYITRDKFVSLRSGKIEKGDLVYCLRGATFGKTAFVHPYEEGAIASSLMIVRPVLSSMAKYIYTYLISPLGKNQLQRFDNGSAQPNLSANSVKKYHFPLCSIYEQVEISRILDLQLSVLSRNEAEISDALNKSNMLRQSILKKAFSGLLVPQDPKDEPASELLKRIAEEKAEIEAAAKAAKAAAKKAKPKKPHAKSKEKT
ncbi:restriction endonuclease subunit S [Microbulbifer variabilis]|uniref:restriction endonuclease subunit S n=1 Tax=Microbulbifer variabilis TaxID=266805 RepID=UPI00035D75BE|nr:restriction endonuclease subunit S [Microbulbifer variabilis]